MKLLVTTSQSLLLVDTDSGGHTVLDRGNGLYYGIAEANGKLFVASRQRAVSSGAAQKSERGRILVFDKKLQLQGWLIAPFPLRDLHEIAWHEGKLYASCSHDNMVAIYDGAQWEQWFPLGGSLDDGIGPGDLNHFNSFFFEDGRIWVLAHNRGPSELLAYSLATRELVERVHLGDSAHNIWREGGQLSGELYTCSSINGKIVGDRGFALETGGFPRGVAFAPSLRCVGVSAMAERKARDFTTGKLALYDETWKLQKEIVLHDEGLVLDLRWLPPGFEYQPPQIETEEAPAGKSANSFYRAYEDRNRGSRELIKSRLLAYRPFFEPWVTREPAPRALDLGCGRGEWLEVLREAGYAVSGIDLDTGMLAGLRRQGYDVRRMDVLEALRNTPDASVALVSAFHLVEHIPFDEVRNLIREAWRVLQPGGLLILETPNPENPMVGSNLFYQDPTHLRPLPPELLRFAVEFEGFERHVVARLQEDPSLHGTREIGLWTVLEGTSPDYAVIGQKRGDERFLRVFDAAFGKRYGMMLPELATRYDIQERRRGEDILTRYATQSEQSLRALSHELHNRLAQAEARIAQLEQRVHMQGEQLQQVFQSPAWIATAPLRWLATQIRLVRKMGLRTRLAMARAKLSGKPEQPVAESKAPSADDDMSVRTRQLYQDLQAAAKQDEDRR